MFIINNAPAPATSPVHASFANRLTALALGRHHVAYIYPTPDNSTFRYRVANMLEALDPLPDIGASWFTEAELLNIEGIVDAADVIVLARCKYSVRFARLIALARARHKRVLFDIDDLVFDTQYVLAVLNHLGHSSDEADLDYWFADYGRYGALLRLCDGVIVTNEFLAARVLEFAPLPVDVVPNFMNAAQLAYSAPIRAHKLSATCERDGRIHLGYFSGSPTHQRDFELLQTAVMRLMAEDPRIVLRVVGRLDIGEHFDHYRDRVEVFPLQDPLSLQRLIGEVEINLVPLRNNLFTNCKSELKFFEAASIGTITVASPTFAFAAAIEDGTTGFLTPAHYWYDGLQRAVHSLDGDYFSIAKSAAEVALERYIPQRQTRTVATVLFPGMAE
jgi:glycosyltransferase involved in cell wall biosynthesis